MGEFYLRVEKLRVSVALLFVAVVVLMTSGIRIEAAGLTATSLRFNRMRASTASTLRLTFTVPAGNVATENYVRIGFPDAFTIATSSLTTDTASCGATALPGALAAAGNNTNGQKSITISGVTNLVATTTYCVDIGRTSTDDPVTNPASGIYSISIDTEDSGNNVIDSSVIGARVISDDQIVISAVVPPSFNFVLDGNATSFESALDTGDIVMTTPRTVTITTNATQGWIAWALSSNVGLTSAAAGHTIASTTPGTGATLSPGTEGYVLGVTATDAVGGGTVTITGAYAGGAGDDNGSGLDTTFRQIASADGTADGDVLTLRGKAGVASMTPAGVDYTDTWTVIGAGSF